MPQTPLLLVVSGPAGVGKTTLCTRMLEVYPSLQRVITSTTRQPRPGEKDGVDYHFLSPEAYQEALDAGEFYEFAEVHGNGYGTFKQEILGRLSRGEDLLLNIDVQGAESYRNAATQDPAIGQSLVSLIVAPKSLEALKERMFSRGHDAPEIVARRLKNAEEEISHRDHFDHCIVSDTKEADFSALQSIYLHEKEARQ